MEARIQPPRKARDEAKARLNDNKNQNQIKNRVTPEIESELIKNRGKIAQSDASSTKDVSESKKNGKASDTISEESTSTKSKVLKEITKKKVPVTKVQKKLSSKTDDDIILAKKKSKPTRRSRSVEVAKVVVKKTAKKDAIPEETDLSTMQEIRRKKATTVPKKITQQKETADLDGRAKKIAAPKKNTLKSAISENDTDPEKPQPNELTKKHKIASALSEDGSPPTKMARGEKAVAILKQTRPPNLSENSDISTGESEDDDSDPPKEAVVNKTTQKKTMAAAAKNKEAAAKNGLAVKVAAKQSSIETDGMKTNVPSTSKDSKKLQNNVITDYSKIDFDIKEKYNFKIVSWNVAGLRALVKKNPNYFIHEAADVVCMTEVKCSSPSEVPKEANIEGYYSHWNIGKEGPGVGLLSKIQPKNISDDLPGTDFSNEHRLITAEFEKFFLVVTYVVNSGRGLKTLEKRMSWNDAFNDHVGKLDKKKPVIIAGDMNVSHQEIDLTNPKTSKKLAGFTKEERDGFSDLLEMGFVDTFRYFHPDTVGAYTFWTYMNNARAKNIGWRLDYFVASKRFIQNIKQSIMRPTVLGSDHCPVVLFLDL